MPEVITVYQFFENEGNTWVETVQVSESVAQTTCISGWVFDTIDLMDADVITADVSGAVLTMTATTDGTDLGVKIVAEDTDTDDIVEEGSSFRTLYGDLNATDDDSYYRNLGKLEINVRRKWRSI